MGTSEARDSLTIPLETDSEAVGHLLRNIFAAPEHRPGPPYTHTLVAPEPEDEDEP
jgi:hypothetical protein